MWVETATAALRDRKVLELQYDGYSRCLEVHAVGWSSTGHAVMRAWQVSGGSRHGERTGWKLMRLSDARAAAITEMPAEVPRRGYKRGDPAMKRIVSEL